MFEHCKFTKAKDGKAINDDTVNILESPNQIVAFVADGVSNSNNGYLASQMANKVINHQFKNNINFTLSSALFDLINSEISLLNKKTENKLLHSATTLTILSISINGKLSFAHVGDCRIYILRGNGLKTLTVDQTEKQLLIQNGILNKARAAAYKKNKLYSALGSSFNVEYGAFDLINNDRIVICSDGIYNIFSKKYFVNNSINNKEFKYFKDTLLNQFDNTQFGDDASAVLLEYKQV